jgi:hypothetical protein
MRYETDGARAILFFGARGGAGLDRALTILAIWLVGSIVVGGLVAGVVDHFRGKDPVVIQAKRASPAATADAP